MHGKSKSHRHWKKSPFMQGREIVPVRWKKEASISDIINGYEKSCFEARNVAKGAKLLKEMIEKNDTIWLGVAGAGPVGGLGGYIIDLLEAGFINAICSTGAQVYHDGHFAFHLPVVQGNPKVDDNVLDEDGTTRIYDINVRMEETLIKQDKIFRNFAKSLEERTIRSTADYSNEWGKFVLRYSRYPERSWVAKAAELGVPVYWDSESNHSIGMNNAALYARGINIDPSPSKSLLEGAAIVYNSSQVGFFELGGGGPKNWIQTLAPMISQIFKVKFEGADRGIQITTAFEKDGGLSGCTFGEAVTWGKYKDAKSGLVQIWGEYSVIFPLLVGYVIENCKPRKHIRLYDKKDEFLKKLLKKIR